MTAQLATEVPYRFFDVRVTAVRRLSPSLLRVAFGGADLHLFADNGFDQRIKVILPLPGRGFASFPTGPDWYARYLTLPDDERNPVRTYTVRAVRHDRAGLSQVEVDFVLHGDSGPASAWACAAASAAAAASDWATCRSTAALLASSALSAMSSSRRVMVPSVLLANPASRPTSAADAVA